MENWATGNLFDWAASRSRRCDPVTSKIADDQIQETLSDLQEAFMAGLRDLGEATSNEVAAKVAGADFCKRNSVRKRAFELVRMGRIEICGSRPCKTTNRKASTYRIAKDG